ncbi:MAG TPA: CHC2 zinc finger domain-containing protein [Ktedonobacteraceae bacterium]|nr:CHC2 zinc finger domain-containing protein [Ktedonobacteraceae bacterium]
MTSLIETIKAKIDVVEEIGLVVALQKAGKSYRGLCPFHNERTPSFHVFAETQTWRCFGCNEGGDVFAFVEKQQGLDFREALHYLAEKAGVAVEEQTHRDPEVERERNAARERLRKLNEEALLWYHQVLLRARDASEARAYLQSRGITSESVIAFSLGYAPEQWDGLSRYLLGHGYTERELVDGGLAREREMGAASGVSHGEVGGEGEDRGGGVYDYFRNRIVFPIRDMRGRVIGFGGRAMGNGQPKYLNSPQTLLFEKNNVLYAIDRARESIKLAKQVVIVEGYVDAVIAHQYGTKQTVACIGSAITEKHIQQLKSLTKQVTLALDPDAAGEAATERGIQEALKAFDRTVVPVPVVAESYAASARSKKRQEQRGIIRLEEQVDAEINVARLPPGEDPDELIQRDFKAWSDAISHPLPLIDYYFVAKTAGLELKQPNGKAEAAKRLLPVIGAISDRIKRDAYIQKLSTMIGIDERSLNEELQRVLRGHGGQRTTGVTAVFSDRGGRRASRERDETGGRQLLPDHHVIEDAAGDVERGLDEDDLLGQRSGTANRTFGLDRNGKNRVQWEDYLIGLLLANPELSTQVCGIINDGDFAGTDTRELYRFFNSVDQRGSSPLFQSIEQAVPSALLTTIDRARKSVESRSPLDGAGLVKAAVQCATRLKRARLLQLNMELQHLMREAENAGEVEAVQQFRRQFSTIHRELRTIDSAMHLHG